MFCPQFQDDSKQLQANLKSSQSYLEATNSSDGEVLVVAFSSIEYRSMFE